MSDRKVMVTRTVTTRKVTAVFLNKDSNEVFEREHLFNGKLTDKKVEQLLNASCSDNEKFVYIKDSVNEDAIYGMELNEFLKHAEKIEKR